MNCRRCGFDFQELESFNPRFCIRCGEKIETEQEQKQETLTVEEVSVMLRLTKGSVYQYVRRGIIPAYRVGKILRFDKEKIESIRRGTGKE